MSCAGPGQERAFHPRECLVTRGPQQFDDKQLLNLKASAAAPTDEDSSAMTNEGCPNDSAASVADVAEYSGS